MTHTYLINLYLILPLNIDVVQKFWHGDHIFFHFLVTPDNTVSNTVNGICESWHSLFSDLRVSLKKNFIFEERKMKITKNPWNLRRPLRKYKANFSTAVGHGKKKLTLGLQKFISHQANKLETKKNSSKNLSIMRTGSLTALCGLCCMLKRSLVRETGYWKLSFLYKKFGMLC